MEEKKRPGPLSHGCSPLWHGVCSLTYYVSDGRMRDPTTRLKLPHRRTCRFAKPRHCSRRGGACHLATYQGHLERPPSPPRCIMSCLDASVWSTVGYDERTLCLESRLQWPRVVSLHGPLRLADFLFSRVITFSQYGLDYSDLPLLGAAKPLRRCASRLVADLINYTMVPRLCTHFHAVHHTWCGRILHSRSCHIRRDRPQLACVRPASTDGRALRLLA